MLALTQGDPAGIGIEIAIRAWQSRATPAFAMFGDLDGLRTRAEQLGLVCAFERVAIGDIERAARVFDVAIPVIETGHAIAFEPGVPDPASAAGTLASIEQAVDAVHGGYCTAVVTNPIAKNVLYEAGFSHPGHTEFLGVLADRRWNGRHKAVMLLWSELLAVAPVTIHIPLRAVPDALTQDAIIQTAQIVARDMIVRFAIARPRLAFCGLNPHAGESGTLGREDEEIVRPAVQALLAAGLDVVGPLPADTMFHAAARARYDVAIAMYHDQGLIPIKTLAFDEGVNATLGLPFVRTSPDHGTAFDIAAQGIARPDSLIAALRLAQNMVDCERLSRAAAHKPPR